MDAVPSNDQLPTWKIEGSFSVTVTGPSSSSQTYHPPQVSTSAGGKARVNSASQSNGNDVGFSFVNVAHPNDARGSSNKRAIRSHVARVQHSKTRASNTATKQASQARTQNRSLVPRVKADPAREDACQTSSSSDDADDAMAIERRSRHDSGGEDSKGLTFPIINYMVSSLRGGRHDPFWTYPVPFHPHMERIVDHYVVDILIDVPFVVPPDQPGLLQREWMPLCMGETATFRAMSLMGAAHYSVVNPSFRNKIDLLALKGKVISDINEALGDPVRAKSDSIIAAVLKLASWEAVFGEPEQFHAHMHGLQQMILLRGGMSKLGMNGVLERSVLWIDSNASHHLGTPHKFDRKHFPSIYTHPVPEQSAAAKTADAPPPCPTYELAANPPPSMTALRVAPVA